MNAINHTSRWFHWVINAHTRLSGLLQLLLFAVAMARAMGLSVLLIFAFLAVANSQPCIECNVSAGNLLAVGRALDRVVRCCD
jgi:hypothetical protein